MKHAYLIMAHNQWDLLIELIKTIDDGRNDIYLHIDKKANPPIERIKSSASHSHLYFTKRYNVVWGGTQMMHCVLSMLQESVKHDYSRYHFLSGTDFPIKSQDYLHEYFDTYFEKELIGFDWSGINSGRFIDRNKYYHFFINIIGKRNDNRLFYRVLTQIEDLSLMIQRKLHVNRLNYMMYKGSSWFSITHELASTIVHKKKEITRRYKYTANSDESWLQTFVMEEGFENQVADNNARYIKWIQGNPSPQTLTITDYDEIVASDKFYARKFDWNEDCKIIEKLKEHISKG